MKIRLKKVGQILIPAEPVSKSIFEGIYDGEYNCQITKPRIKQTPDEVRRAAQNQLMWDTFKQMVDQEMDEGWSDEDYHRHYKVKYLQRIFARDNITYSAMISALEEVSLMRIEALDQNDEHLASHLGNILERLNNGIVEQTSTTRASVKQFSEYLTKIINEGRAAGVIFKIDQWLFDAAGYEDY